MTASQAGGFDFLGYHFERGKKWPRKKSMGKLKDATRTKTRRTDGRSLKAIYEDLNRTLQGWFGYFKHSKDNVFESVDGYTRGRLRSILRKRMAKHGRGCGRDNQRWPNIYFTALGLISLRQAYLATCRFGKLTHQMESRARVIRLPGSEGGAT
jgi:RNA-directed DNA polymerase